MDGALCGIRGEGSSKSIITGSDSNGIEDQDEMPTVVIDATNHESIALPG